MEAVLLYYQYVDLTDKAPVVSGWMREMCEALQLKGRVRVALDGLNVTVGGSLRALQQHIDEVRRYDALQGDSIDFKLAEVGQSLEPEMVAETGFDCLAVNLTKEVVSFGASPPHSLGRPPEAAPHVSPQDFHALLAAAGAGNAAKEVVLLDARNLYETRIGHMQAAGVAGVGPRTRCFSELRSWLDSPAAAEILAGRTVLMYCTGGVRCERASAHLRAKGAAFADVLQLRGGIQRYLEAFPDGGFFIGSNFVFDARGAVPGGSLDMVGACLLCAQPWDSYAARRRCAACRMLLLVCAACAQVPTATLELCELCCMRWPRPVACPTIPPALPSGPAGPRHRLRILCLHGFRQTGAKFRGRTAALARRLADLAEVVFVDAPHVLPFFYKVAPPSAHPAAAHEAIREARAAPNAAEPGCGTGGDASCNEHAAAAGASGAGHAATRPPVHLAYGVRAKRAWLVEPGSAALAGNCEMADLGHRAACGQDYGQSSMPRAATSLWEAAPANIDPWQHMRQTEGWAASGEVLQDALESLGPFDGVLGFSQGAAVAAVLCALQQEQDGGTGHAHVEPDSPATTPYMPLPIIACGAGRAGSFAALPEQSKDAPVSGPSVVHNAAASPNTPAADSGKRLHCPGEPDVDIATDRREACGGEGKHALRFAILCSGYPSPAPEHRELHARVGPIRMPSLHVFGVAMAEASTPRLGHGPSCSAHVTQPESAAASCCSCSPNKPSELSAISRLQPNEGRCCSREMGVAKAEQEQQVEAVAVVGGGRMRRGDAQVLPAESARLAAKFDASAGRVIVQHKAGHIVPTTQACIAAYRAFLQQFCQTRIA